MSDEVVKLIQFAVEDVFNGTKYNLDDEDCIITFDDLTFNLKDNYFYWLPWIQEACDMTGAMGNLATLPYAGGYKDQPYIDMVIYRVIRNKWNELTNAKIKS